MKRYPDEIFFYAILLQKHIGTGRVIVEVSHEDDLMHKDPRDLAAWLDGAKSSEWRVLQQKTFKADFVWDVLDASEITDKDLREIAETWDYEERREAVEMGEISAWDAGLIPSYAVK